MPRRERDRELARRRKRRKERNKLRAKGVLETAGGSVKQSDKKKPEKVLVKEAPQEAAEKSSPGS
jgi:hypothetical protein